METEYLGYVQSRDGIKPQPKKVQAILALTTPQNVKQLRRFLGMVQYYRDIWARRSEILAPLTNLVVECGHTKVTRVNKTKKKPWHWEDIHQQAFDTVKATIARDVTLAYPDYSQGFEIYTDSSKFQLGAVITQNNRPLAFFSRKLSQVQQKYSVTEQELLVIVETLKEFKGMLWGQQITVYTDHKNLMQDALGLTSDRVYRWRLLLEEYGPTIVYIKGIHNTVADTIFFILRGMSKINLDFIHYLLVNNGVASDQTMASLVSPLVARQWLISNYTATNIVKKWYTQRAVTGTEMC
eukprot:CCRYP_017075-RB/>CCRYP_017075-RB protein AED:0.54 eAED:0.54 QI:0/-1/0/1/-1/0/1/0/295